MAEGRGHERGLRGEESNEEAAVEDGETTVIKPDAEAGTYLEAGLQQVKEQVPDLDGLKLNYFSHRLGDLHLEHPRSK